ncbi:phosphate signaling complex protein PhoU [Caldinitratiruptor microaerophilus]|uniref:Phosphate-specific transport system accessory protein PhoU n=1 Tax=Caldinitratiruptor microaerophilus TaxID=671077 RepID=A0AA35CHH7_9FIRM|nr:phosphate signaling complex protein PhoU [Caldinitratiruptor microaerophilus]BDG59069.1 phosphate transport system regulatory protein PhoU [Caldinitratiruptor microaerophilus]
MTRQSFHQELADLRRDLARMGTRVEEAIAGALRSLIQRDTALAQQVIDGDDAIDAMELEIEERCLTLVALQQPMASDLRVIGATLKAITDLERLADHAVDIARITIRLGDQPFIKPLIDIPRMGEIAQGMVRDALTAYIRQDADLAYDMIKRDHELDHLYRQIFDELVPIMGRDPSTVPQAAQLLFVAMHLERIGDHATNIGEWVIYMVTGERRELNE